MHELVIRSAAACAAAVLLSHDAAAAAGQPAADHSPAAKSRFDSGIYKGAFSPQLCERSREVRSALCKDTPKALTDIALRVRSIVPVRSQTRSRFRHGRGC